MLKIEKVKETYDVYDLSVPETECFFANEILVHNCGEIALRNNGFCNLSEAVIRENDTLDDLKEEVRLATIIGTFQSALTDFRYLRSVWKKNAEEERLLGVSLTGIMDHPILSKVSDESVKWLKEMKQVAYDTNDLWSEKLGIEKSVALTTGKPSGCTTLDTEIKTGIGYHTTMRNIFRSAGFTEEKLIQMAENGIEKQWLIEGRENIRKIPRLSNLTLSDENNEVQFISGLYLNGIETVYEIEFEDGKIYSFTGNHKLMTKDKEWKRVDELTEDDEILSFPS